MLFRGDGACSQQNLWYLRCVAGYRRSLSRGELQQIRRQKMRVLFFCGLVTVSALGVVSGVIYLMYAFALP